MKLNKSYYRFIAILLIQSICSLGIAQQWVMDEVAEDARDTGTNPFTGLIGLAILVGIVWLYNTIKESHKNAKHAAEAVKERAENERLIAIAKKKKEDAKREAKYNIGQPVDLGLSVMWSSTNLMAKFPFENGGKFCWGGLTNSRLFAYADGVLNKKWDWDLREMLGNDERSICGNKSYDAATYILEDKWRLPQRVEFEELIRECRWVWTSSNGIYGYKVIGKNGNSIFLPITGEIKADELINNNMGVYWSGIGSHEYTSAVCLRITEDKFEIYDFGSRWHGMAIRPVYQYKSYKVNDIIEEVENKSQDLINGNYYEKYRRTYDITKRPDSNDFHDNFLYKRQYSTDGEKLVSILFGAGRERGTRVDLNVKEGTKIICDCAYDDYNNRFVDYLTFPSSVYAIGNHAFCILMAHSITIPSSVKYITGNPFTQNCGKILCESPSFCIENNNLLSSDKKLYVAKIDYNDKACIPHGILCIGRNAFVGHQEIDVTRIPSSCKYIADNAFANCKNLKVVIFEDFLDIVEPSVFNGCDSLKRICVPIGSKNYFSNIISKEHFDKVKEYDNILDEQEILLSVILEETAQYTKYSTEQPIHKISNEDLSLISEYKKSLEISKAKQNDWNEKYTDWGNDSENEHDIWDSGEASYSNDKKKFLSKESEGDYEVFEGVEIICDYSFSNYCRNQKIVFLSTTKVIGDFVFWNSCLDEFVIPESVSLITGNPFAKTSVKLICKTTEYVFEDCLLFNKAKDILISCITDDDIYDPLITIPDGVKIIGRHAFYGHNNSKDFVIPNSVVYIGESAFDDTIISNITLSDNTIEIAEKAFQNAYIKKILLPYSIKNIGKNAFASCDNLLEIEIPGSIKVIEERCFEHCKKLKKVVIKEGVKEIKSGAFCFCSNLVEVYIPGTVEVIEKDAFECCGLTTIVISSDTQYHSEAFDSKCKIIKK